MRLGACAGQGELLVKPVMEGQADLTIALFLELARKGDSGWRAWPPGPFVGRMEVTEPLSGSGL